MWLLKNNTNHLIDNNLLNFKRYNIFNKRPHHIIALTFRYEMKYLFLFQLQRASGLELNFKMMTIAMWTSRL